MAILELHSIHKSFRRGFLGVRTPVLKGVDLAIEPGELFGFLGHNGAGKSTTMKIILGLLRPDQGHTVVFGEVGLAGEVRPVQRGQERLREAAKLGFTHAIVPAANRPKQAIEGLTVIGVDRVTEAVEFGV